MSFFKHHVFFCINERANNEACCQQFGASSIQAYAKKRIQELNLSGVGQIRINRAGCLGRCSEGPILVVYPDNIWYQYIDEDDIEEIIQSHLINGKIVDRLKI